MSTDNVLPKAPADPDWKFCYTVEVRFRDIDMFLHVNNAAYLTYMESARVAYCTYITGITNPRDFDLTIAHTEIDYLKPVFFGQTLHVYTRASRIGTKSWTLEHEMRDAANGDVMARGSTVNVFFEHDSGQSKPLTPEFIEKLEAHEGRKLRA